MSRGGWQYKVPKCFVCRRVASIQDPVTGDELCMSCYKLRIELRKAAARRLAVEEGVHEGSSDTSIAQDEHHE